MNLRIRGSSVCQRFFVQIKVNLRHPVMRVQFAVKIEVRNANRADEEDRQHLVLVHSARCVRLRHNSTLFHNCAFTRSKNILGPESTGRSPRTRDPSPCPPPIIFAFLVKRMLAGGLSLRDHRLTYSTNRAS